VVACIDVVFKARVDIKHDAHNMTAATQEGTLIFLQIVSANQPRNANAANH
jgi:hypothetical protein